MKPPAAPAKICGEKKGRLSIGTEKQLMFQQSKHKKMYIRQKNLKDYVHSQDGYIYKFTSEVSF